MHKKLLTGLVYGQLINHLFSNDEYIVPILSQKGFDCVLGELEKSFWST